MKICGVNFTRDNKKCFQIKCDIIKIDNLNLYKIFFLEIKTSRDKKIDNSRTYFCTSETTQKKVRSAKLIRRL